MECVIILENVYVVMTSTGLNMSVDNKFLSNLITINQSINQSMNYESKFKINIFSLHSWMPMVMDDLHLKSSGNCFQPSSIQVLFPILKYQRFNFQSSSIKVLISNPQV